MAIKSKAEKSGKVVNLNSYKSEYKNTGKPIDNIDETVIKELKKQIKKILSS